MTAQLVPALVFQGITATGAPLAGGQLFTYAAGTTTPQATYVDSTQTVPNTNPVILNAMGQANVWLNPALAYKFILQDAAGNQLYSVDNILGPLSVLPVVIGPPPTGTALTVNAAAGFSALAVVGTAGVTNFAQTISSPNTAGLSNGLLIVAGTTAADVGLGMSQAGGAPTFAVSGAGGVTVGNITQQGLGTLNAQTAFYVANVKQPIFAAPLAGFGTPTGAVVVANFSGAAATLVQCSNTIAQILLTLKAAGIYAA